MMKLFLNENELSVLSHGKKEYLTPTEFGILETLISNEGKIISSDELYETVWGGVAYNSAPVICVHIRHIRQKIERNPSKPEMLKMRRGKGYVFSA